MPKFKVVGPLTVGGVQPGGVVDLDPRTVNVAALTAAGHIEPLKPVAAPKAGDA